MLLLAVGIIMAVVCILIYEKKQGNNLIVCTEFLINQYLQTNRDKEGLMSYILSLRLPILVLGIINSLNFYNGLIRKIFLVVGSYGITFLILEFYIYYKWRMIALTFGILTPHWYLYFTSLELLERARWCKKDEQIKMFLLQLGVAVITFSIGFILEVTISPIWLKTLIKL